MQEHAKACQVTARLAVVAAPVAVLVAAAELPGALVSPRHWPAEEVVAAVVALGHLQRQGGPADWVAAQRVAELRLQQPQQPIRPRLHLQQHQLCSACAFLTDMRPVGYPGPVSMPEAAHHVQKVGSFHSPSGSEVSSRAKLLAGVLAAAERGMLAAEAENGHLQRSRLGKPWALGGGCCQVVPLASKGALEVRQSHLQAAGLHTALPAVAMPDSALASCSRCWCLRCQKQHTEPRYLFAVCH